MASELPQMNVANRDVKKILVVDDNEILLRVWQRILKKHDCIPNFTTDPAEALLLLKEDGADILIVDVVMPKMDGFELIQKVKKLVPKARIILTTGYPCDFSKMRMSVKAEDIHVLLKPYNDMDEMHKFLTRVFEDDESLDTEDSISNPDDVRVHLWNL